MAAVLAPAGTWRWGRRTGGRLSRTEEFGYTLALARAVVTARRRASPSAATRTVTLAGTPPESAFARAAYDEARDLSSPALLAHCLRAWLYADLLAQARGVRHDPELLYIACVLHDLGLTEAQRQEHTGCFAVAGARAAHELAAAHGYTRGDDLADAVSLHLDVTVPLSRGAEAHLLHAGTTTDLLGLGLGELPARSAADVVARYPGAGIAAELTVTLREQAATRPRTRIAILERRADFTGRMQGHWARLGA